MTRRLGLGSAITGLLAAALTSLAAPSATAADPMYQAPVVGQCFDMSVAELGEASYAEAAVDCAAEHTSQVIAVAQVPDGVAYESKALVRFALETCFPAQRKAVGASKLGLRLTSFNLGYFIPTVDQQAAGARWLRCDLVLSAGSRLAPLPGKLQVGRFPFKDTVARCLSGREFVITVCAEKHTFRATAALRVDAERFPSESAWQRLGERRCRSAVRSSYFRFGWPSKASWKAGDRVLVCYTQTRR
ncbi:septum formation family protein [Nocardioides sp.]|uniref:septum formation family protein n=1 Tax=Nocardioides sp. TaxID=35761 RepID=UPI0026236F50|nr:septum formation family protein [Nocardioides sp.]MCW2739147.1 hypothetical protein [Nocardioides sp.]